MKHNNMAKKDPLADEFIPKGYEPPKSSGYMKFVQGKNKFRILSSLVTGWEYWTNEDKCVRSKTEFTETPNIKVDPKTGKKNISHVWFVVVYDYADETIKILEITQRGIQKYILGLVNEADWGSPKKYDLVVTRDGEGFNTKYTVAANPHKDMPASVLAEYEESDIDLESLFEDA